MTLGTVLLLVLAVAGGLYLVGTPGGGTPPPVMTASSYRPLAEETARALAAIAQARRSLPRYPEAAEEDLATAAAALRRLDDYYLPLVNAREHAYRAHLLHLGEGGERAAREVAAVEEILLAMSEKDPPLARSLRLPLTTMIAARSELASGSPAATDRLERLGREINLLILKGDLALAGVDLENP